MKKEEFKPYKINAVKKGEDDKFVVTIGESLALPNEFDTQEEAEEFLEENVKLTEAEWQLIGTFALEITKLTNSLNQIKEEEK